jgi:hypothetical protein
MLSLIGALACVALFAWLSSRITDVRITNDTRQAVQISSCDTDVIEIDAGATETEEVPRNESKLGCDVYSAVTNEYLGCLSLMYRGKLSHDVRISHLRRQASQNNC